MQEMIDKAMPFVPYFVGLLGIAVAHRLAKIARNSLDLRQPRPKFSPEQLARRNREAGTATVAVALIIIFHPLIFR